MSGIHRNDKQPTAPVAHQRTTPTVWRQSHRSAVLDEIYAAFLVPPTGIGRIEREYTQQCGPRKTPAWAGLAGLLFVFLAQVVPLTAYAITTSLTIEIDEARVLGGTVALCVEGRGFKIAGPGLYKYTAVFTVNDKVLDQTLSGQTSERKCVTIPTSEGNGFKAGENNIGVAQKYSYTDPSGAEVDLSHGTDERVLILVPGDAAGLFSGGQAVSGHGGQSVLWILR